MKDVDMQDLGHTPGRFVQDFLKGDADLRGKM
mgnify:CR=1 FL=1